MSRIRAPKLPQNYPWLNTDKPLSLESLKGRVVILDFWTYCCINCLHVLPDLEFLEQKYPDSLTIIGIHSAKFENEKDVENVRQAILRYDIGHPVLVDSGSRVWQQYAVRAWPTFKIIDPEGYIVGSVSGEGKRDVLDEIIGKLIEEHQDKGTINFSEVSSILEKQKQPLTTPLAFPGKVLADSDTNQLFVADSGHHRIVVSTLEGEVLHIIGTGKAGLINGSFSEAQFFAPQGMTFDAKNQVLYVADTENHALRKIDFRTQQVETIAGTGEKSYQISPHSGVARETKLNSPWDVDKIGGRIFIAMAGSHQIWLLQLDTGIISTYAGTGAEACVDGSLTESAFAQPSGISTDGNELFVADSEISSIRAVGINKHPKVRTICGSGGLFGFGDKDGRGSEVLLQHCLGIEYTQNYVWVADTYNHKIKRVEYHAGLCLTMLGNGTVGNQDGQGINCSFFEPSGLSAIAQHLFIADTNNCVIRKVELDTLEVITVHFPGLCAPDVCLPS
ncbi:thioredoxin-like domain-containing protein [Okeania sp. SIO2B3]|uniref:thioredoxin-like domain-containing protein n=1 Tax=Okeania sp. SIO2B3 TaxID=2607784 RepID=UPI0013C20E6E|nr:thioredoxin-like domain-containing protein [Okeania sp. SIO2B3]NET45911.1 redoxin domain-containing protein [Okeania sp. SIO2B3]